MPVGIRYCCLVTIHSKEYHSLRIQPSPIGRLRFQTPEGGLKSQPPDGRRLYPQARDDRKLFANPGPFGGPGNEDSHNPSTQYLVLNKDQSEGCETELYTGVDRLLNFQLLGATTEAIQTGKMKGKNLHVHYESSLTKVVKYRKLTRQIRYIHQKFSHLFCFVINVHIFYSYKLFCSIDNSVCRTLRTRRWALSRCISRYCA